MITKDKREMSCDIYDVHNASKHRAGAVEVGKIAWKFI